MSYPLSQELFNDDLDVENHHRPRLGLGTVLGDDERGHIGLERIHMPRSHENVVDGLELLRPIDLDEAPSLGVELQDPGLAFLVAFHPIDRLHELRIGHRGGPLSVVARELGRCLGKLRFAYMEGLVEPRELGVEITGKTPRGRPEAIRTVLLFEPRKLAEPTVLEESERRQQNSYQND